MVDKGTFNLIEISEESLYTIRLILDNAKPIVYSHNR
jgi:hypothetical protein